MKQKLKISAIIPTFNEEKTIENIVTVLLSHPLIDETICVDDGSSDKSLAILQKLKTKIKLISFKKNHGKGNALAAGIKAANGDLVLFLDADIVNLAEDDITALIKPMTLSKSPSVVLGYPIARHYFAKLFLPLTGERVYKRKDLLPHIEKMKKKGYGVETYLNSLFPKNKIEIVKLKNLILLEKREKHGFNKSLKTEWKAWTQVSREMVKREGLAMKDYQTIKNLKRLKDAKEMMKKLNEISNKKVKTTLKRAFAEIFYD